jgi:nucleotide-binding universal stress UspA family protein
MKKILLPIDFSGHTEITCSYALEYARKEGAELRLFHSFFEQIVLADSSFPDAIDVSTMYNEELLKEISRQNDRKMTELKEKIEEEVLRKKLANITVTTSLTGGEIENELKETYKFFQPDIIILGAKGLGKNLNIWGRVSTMIISHSDIPVMAIPEIHRFQGFSRIMIAASLREDITGSIHRTLELFKPFSPKLFCVHFLSKTKQKDEAEKMQMLRERFANEEKTGVISFEMRKIESDNQETVDKFVKDFGIELIAFQPHRHGILFKLFTKKITKKNLFATNVPLLALPVVKSR